MPNSFIPPESETQLSEDVIVDRTITDAQTWLFEQQAADGHWAFELEADATIPAEYIMLNHFLGEPNDEIERKLAVYLRRIQGSDGGWPLFHDGDYDLSATVKAYLALKLVGDDVDAPHMRKARDVILASGGASKANVFTRITLALFGFVPWRAAPVIRPEAILLPRWAPFHIDKVSYWSRTVMIPLFVLAALKPKAKNPRDVGIRELFVADPFREKDFMDNPTGHPIGSMLLGLDRVARLAEPLIPKRLEKVAVERCMAFVRERLNGEDGLGGIFPAMANAMMAFKILGVPDDDPDVVIARKAIDKLLIVKEDEAYCQPCLSPVWDTSLSMHALMEAGGDEEELVDKAAEWLKDRQILDVKGDWATKSPSARPGGWAFQYWNDHYPDVDDTAVVVMALHRLDPEKYKEAIERGAEWILAMQSKNGGWGAFDIDNDKDYLNHIPFADHGALLDPPTADVSARCVGMLAQLGYEMDHPAVKRGIDFLKSEQEEDGSWFGRWGTNYVYGTWSVLSALNGAGEDMNAPYVRKAVGWLKSRQRTDGGWGEDGRTYWEGSKDLAKDSTPSQTAWALLGLMAAGEVDCQSVKRGVDYLLAHPRDGGKWEEELFNAVGFPKVFYITYHGYSGFFPLWSLARYRNLKRSNTKRPTHGI